METIKTHKAMTDEGEVSTEHHIEKLRIDALSDGMQSFRETTSVLKCWSQFAVHHKFAKEGAELPPTSAGLIAWSRMFSCSGTFGNYTSKLKLACELDGVSTKAPKHDSLKRWGGDRRRNERPLLLKGKPIGYDEMRFVKQCEVGGPRELTCFIDCTFE